MLSGLFVEIYEHYQKPVLKFLIFSKNYFQKHKSSAQSFNFDLMWLVNVLILTFLATIKCAHSQFNLIILSRVIEYTIYRQTDRHFRKNHVFWLRGSQRSLRRPWFQATSLRPGLKILPSLRSAGRALRGRPERLPLRPNFRLARHLGRARLTWAPPFDGSEKAPPGSRSLPVGCHTGTISWTVLGRRLQTQCVHYHVF